MKRGRDVKRDKGERGRRKERKRNQGKQRSIVSPCIIRVEGASKELIYPGRDNWPTSGGAQSIAKDDIK